MILKTKEFQATCKIILLAVDDNAANLELESKNNKLYLNVANQEYCVSVNFDLESTEELRAVVDAKLFLSLVAGLTTDTFELSIKDTKIIIKSGKSKYSAPIIYDNDKIMTLPYVVIQNETVSMNISKDILRSIVEVNSKELVKNKNLDLKSELQNMYYIDETGCFTFTTGGCLNHFTLEKPVKMLLNTRIVKLFRLFESDVAFHFGHDALSNGTVQTKIVLQNENVYLGAIITNDEILINKALGPCTTMKNYIQEKYPHNLVLSVNTLNAALSRLMLFTKNSIANINMLSIPATVSFNATDLTITDKLGNSEVIPVESGSYVDADYSMVLNLADIKLILDSCRDEHITLNCGNHKSVVFTRGNIDNLIPEGRML